MLASSIKTSSSPGYPSSSLPSPGPPPTDSLPGLPTQTSSSSGLDSPVPNPLISEPATQFSSPSSSSSDQPSFAPLCLPNNEQSSNVPFPRSHTYDPSSSSYLQSQEHSLNSHQQQPPASIQSSLIHPVNSQTASTLPSPNIILSSVEPPSSPQTQGHPLPVRSFVGMPRTPSRLLLQQALDLAQIAVGLDQSQDFHEAVVRYQETVSMLRIVMARIESRGNQSKAGIGDGREDQGLTLKGIHDAYLSRISMLQEQLSPSDALSLSDITPEAEEHISQLEQAFSSTRTQSVSPTNSKPTSSSSESTVPLATDTFYCSRRLSNTATEEESSPAVNTNEPSYMSYLDRSASTTSSHRLSDYSQTSSLQNASVSPPIHTELFAAQTSSDSFIDQSRPVSATNTDTESHVHGSFALSHSSSSRSMGDEPDRSAFQRRQSLIESLGLFKDDNAKIEEAMTASTKTRRHVLEDVQESPGPIIKELEMDSDGEPVTINTQLTSERITEQEVGQPVFQEDLSDISLTLSTLNSSPSIYQQGGYGGYLPQEGQPFSQPSQRPLPLKTVSSESFDSSFPSLSSVPSVSRKESFSSVQPAPALSQSLNQVTSSPFSGRSLSSHSSIYPSIPPTVSTIEGSPSLLSTSPPTNGDDRKLSHQSTDRSLMSPPLPRIMSETISASPHLSTRNKVEFQPTLPERIPSDVLYRPFHLMRALRLTMVTPGGGYLTPRLHIPSGAWSQTGVFLQAVDTKVQVIHVLIDYLQAMEKVSMPLLSTITPADTGSNSNLAATGVEFLSLLDSWENMLETVQTTLAKKNVVQHSKKGKSAGSNWGFKISRGLDRLANGKNIDTLQAYSSCLKRLFAQSQFLDTHLRSFNSSEPSLPSAPHLSLPVSTRIQIEARLKRTSDFFGQVIIAFVLKDLVSLLDKYTKNVEKWILE